MKSTDAGVAKTQGILLRTDAGPFRLPGCYRNTTAHLLKGDRSPRSHLLTPLPPVGTMGSPSLPVNVPLQMAFAFSPFPFCLTPNSV